ncbi:hypothetical protein L0Z72_08495 [candidate division KSB1 bacterium]|nr:hypothetical protein [candidate division KSB1 bacterium]
MKKIKVGTEVESYCGKCKLDTLHVITAVNEDKIEKAMCKVCMSYHKYRKPADETTAAAVVTRKPKEKSKKIVTKRRTRRDKWTRMLDDVSSDSAIEYAMDRIYELETAIHHKTFGLGVVKNIIDDQKIAVLFHDGQKILVQNFHRP